MDMCHREHLHQVDLLAPARKKITDREYRAGRREQKKLEERNRQILADGLTPRKTEFQTQKEFSRSAIENVAALSCRQEDFQKLLLEKYNIKLKISRGRFSYLHLERSKYMTGRMPGTHYEKGYLLKMFEENAKEKEIKKQKIGQPHTRQPEKRHHLLIVMTERTAAGFLYNFLSLYGTFPPISLPPAES